MSIRQLTEQARSLLPHQLSDAQRFVQPLRGLSVLSYPRPTSFESSFYTPALCLILQGRKLSTFAGRTYRPGPGECMVVSHEVPVLGRIEGAPGLAILFDIEIDTLRSLYNEIPTGEHAVGETRALEVHKMDSDVIGALERYLALAESPVDAQVLGPMISREIHYRLVRSPFGGMLRALLNHDSHASSIARAIGLIRRDFRASLAIPEIARSVGMSTSLFYQQFKAITGCTPLQYQKELRLLEAKRLLSTSSMSVSAAAYDVGYESPNQFSREYARKFGVPPSKHMAQLAS